jgi:hypothetical protein
MSELQHTVGEGKVDHVHMMMACWESGSIATLILYFVTGWR